MKELAIVLRAAQFYAHHAHNIAKGSTFFEDHEFFGEAYAAYESGYDRVIERMIGLGQSVDINDIGVKAMKMASDHDSSGNDDCFEYLMEYEKAIVEMCDRFNASASLGTQNMLQGLADDSEMRQYKIGQRLK